MVNRMRTMVIEFSVIFITLLMVLNNYESNIDLLKLASLTAIDVIAYYGAIFCFFFCLIKFVDLEIKGNEISEGIFLSVFILITITILGIFTVYFNERVFTEQESLNYLFGVSTLIVCLTLGKNLFKLKTFFIGLISIPFLTIIEYKLTPNPINFANKFLELDSINQFIIVGFLFLVLLSLFGKAISKKI